MNVLIVDDETQIRRWLDVLLRKTDLPLDIVASCGNGREALEICRQQPVDIVITDIKMPLMDGIDLIRALKDEAPHIRTVILSSYSEFHYASEALKAGARDYLLKAEITVDGLKNVIGKVAAELEQEQTRVQEVHELKSTLNSHQYALRSLYFNELLRGKTLDEQEFGQKMETFRLRLKPKHIVLMLIRLDSALEEETNAKIRDIGLLDSAVLNIVDETLQSEVGCGGCFVCESGFYAALFNTRPTGERSLRESVQLYAHRIVSHLQTYLGISVSVGISLPAMDAASLPRQFEEAGEALNRKQFYGNKAIALYQDEQGAARTETVQWRDTLGELSLLLDRGQFIPAMQCVDAFLQEAERKKWLSGKEMRAFALEAVFLVQRARRTLKGASDSPSVQERDTPHDEIAEQTSFRQIKEWLLAKVKAGLTEAEAARHPYSEAIRKVCSYVQSEYASDISLQNAADSVHLNKTYLSELFKKETGVSFNDYVTQVRIDRAQAMIRSGETKMGMLAEQVGYPDGSYFTKVFKKMTGMTPLEYKQSHGVKN
ncbi:response regulator [Paenibacillus thalictri]|uniref:Response regulator n=1 Tax=Paenibacillus thalictri TaxID=2527873 RepID=A0A4V2J3U7_9BACL|nr:response regulator [Paenibacillus thalictri]TBL75714.1 response regulator [Paenibacillus thalictri]